MSQDSIFSSRMFNMGGLEIGKTDHLVIDNGRLFFGGDYILEKSPTEFVFINQNTENGQPIKEIPLNADSQRKARRETNLMSGYIKASKPSFITLERLDAEKKKQNEKAGTNANF